MLNTHSKNMLTSDTVSEILFMWVLCLLKRGDSIVAAHADLLMASVAGRGGRECRGGGGHRRVPVRQRGPRGLAKVSSPAWCWSLSQSATQVSGVYGGEIRVYYSTYRCVVLCDAGWLDGWLTSDCCCRAREGYGDAVCVSANQGATLYLISHVATLLTYVVMAPDQPLLSLSVFLKTVPLF